ncbi:MAG: DHA2 family efflux MFS transporter permease subunit [Acidimicrobiaceae bacterium]|nr:DHA2 family efflux MFS transporter permease subunit [Acidimicrobiaceae bacterium]
MSQKVAVSVVFVAAMFMSILDSTIVNVALPTLARNFRVSLASVDTVVIAYLVSLAVFISASAWLGDRLGGRRVLLGSTALFTLASAACGLAGNLPELIAFRIVQGVGGGMMAPVGMALLYRTFPPAERIRASSILTVPTNFAPALGPVLGGLLVTNLSWRWVFYVNLPIGALAILFGLLFLEEQPQARPAPFDLVGFLLAGVGLGAAMYGVSEGPLHGWSTPAVTGTLVIGVGLLVILVLRALHHPAPVIDFRLLSNRLFRSATGVMLFAIMAFGGALYLAPLFLQDGRHVSALTSGLTIFPEALGIMVGAQIATRTAYPLLGPRKLIATGVVVVAVTVACMGLIGAETSLWWLRLLTFVMGMGMAQVFVPCQAAAFATISQQATARASTLFNTQRQIGIAVGVAIVSTVLSLVGLERGLHAYHVSFVVAAVMALAAAGFALTIRDADAASTRPGGFGRRSATAPATANAAVAG